MIRSKNTMEHYGGIPNTDECMEIAGVVSAWILFIVFGIAIIATIIRGGV